MHSSNRELLPMKKRFKNCLEVIFFPYYIIYIAYIDFYTAVNFSATVPP